MADSDKWVLSEGDRRHFMNSLHVLRSAMNSCWGSIYPATGEGVSNEGAIDAGRACSYLLDDLFWQLYGSPEDNGWKRAEGIDTGTVEDSS